MDIPRPERKRQKRIRQTAIAAGVIVLLAAVTIGLTRLEPAAPSVALASVWPEDVKQGEMLIEVRGPGTLEPRSIRWIGAQAEGRVDRVIFRPGAIVEADTVIVEMSNPDLMQMTDEARYEVESAKAAFADLELQLRNKQLDQEATVASAAAEYEAKRLEAVAYREAGNAVSSIKTQQSELVAQQLKVKLDTERERLAQFSKSMASQLAVPRTKVTQSQHALDRKLAQVDSLMVRAGVAGVVQEVLVEEGQRIALGANIARVTNPQELQAELKVPETQARDVLLGQLVRVDTRGGIVEGKVSRIDPAATSGTVQVDVELTGPLPRGARPALSVDGTIEIKRLDNVVYTGRPTIGQPNTTVKLFKVVDGNYAVKVPVELGLTSVNAVEILKGLMPGDRVILSDMSAWDEYDRIRLN
jgi:HlyD family secretion protein